jgi:hypothetical protein
MRKAILEGLVPEFASTPFSNQMVHQSFGRSGSAPANNTGSGMMMPAVNQRAGSGGHPAAGMMSRGGGGQLVVAGSVVGQWGGNYGVATPAGGPHQHNSGMAAGVGGMMGSRGRGGGQGGGYRRNGRN